MASTEKSGWLSSVVGRLFSVGGGTSDGASGPQGGPSSVYSSPNGDLNTKASTLQSGVLNEERSKESPNSRPNASRNVFDKPSNGFDRPTSNLPSGGVRQSFRYLSPTTLNSAVASARRTAASGAVESSLLNTSRKRLLDESNNDSPFARPSTVAGVHLYSDWPSAAGSKRFREASGIATTSFIDESARARELALDTSSSWMLAGRSSALPSVFANASTASNYSPASSLRSRISKPPSATSSALSSRTRCILERLEQISTPGKEASQLPSMRAAYRTERWAPLSEQRGLLSNGSPSIRRTEDTAAPPLRSHVDAVPSRVQLLSSAMITQHRRSPYWRDVSRKPRTQRDEDQDLARDTTRNETRGRAKGLTELIAESNEIVLPEKDTRPTKNAEIPAKKSHTAVIKGSDGKAARPNTFSANGIDADEEEDTTWMHKAKGLDAFIQSTQKGGISTVESSKKEAVKAPSAGFLFSFAEPKMRGPKGFESMEEDEEEEDSDKSEGASDSSAVSAEDDEEQVIPALKKSSGSAESNGKPRKSSISQASGPVKAADDSETSDSTPHSSKNTSPTSPSTLEKSTTEVPKTRVVVPKTTVSLPTSSSLFSASLSASTAVFPPTTTTSVPTFGQPKPSDSSGRTSWGCPDCFVQNKATDSKCVACSYVKYPDEAVVRKDWACTECFVNNKATDSKCVACGFVKYADDKSAAATNVFGNSAFKPTSSSTVFGVGGASTTCTSAPFGFGTSSSASTTTPSITFGIGAKATERLQVLKPTVTSSTSFGLGSVAASSTLSIPPIVFGSTPVSTVTASSTSAAAPTTVASTPSIFSAAANSISTNSNSGILFGLPATKAPLFGNSNVSTASATSSPFGQSAPSLSAFAPPATKSGEDKLTSLSHGQPPLSIAPFGTSQSQKPFFGASSTASSLPLGTTTTTTSSIVFGGNAATTASSLLGATPAVTTAATPFGALTATSASSLFGAPTATSTGGLFGSTTTSTAGGLFGATTTSTGGLFGNSAPFGGTAPTLSSLGSFGSSASSDSGIDAKRKTPIPSSTTTSFGQTSSSSNNLFGQQNAAISSAPSFTGFGASSTPAFSSFGATNSTTPSMNIFNQQPSASQNMFGAPAPATQPSTAQPFGFGQQQASANMFTQPAAAPAPLFPPLGGAITVPQSFSFGSNTNTNEPFQFNSAPAQASAPGTSVTARKMVLGRRRLQRK